LNSWRMPRTSGSSDLVEICGHHFLSRGLGPNSLVLDLGANQGEFARQIQSRWGVRCLSIEANPSICIAWSYETYVINAAVAGRPGVVDFFQYENSENSSLFQRRTESPTTCVQVPAMTLAQIMSASQSRMAALVKVDIEGAEIEALMGASDATLERFQQISVEFHDFALPEISAGDVERVKHRLHALGFCSISFSQRNTDVLFINRTLGLVTDLEIVWLRHVVRNVRGARRVAQRMLRRWWRPP
jgi:FkbM family methyltransferase